MTPDWNGIWMRTLYTELYLLLHLYILKSEATILFLPIYTVAVFLQKDIHRFKIQQMIS